MCLCAIGSDAKGYGVRPFNVYTHFLMYNRISTYLYHVRFTTKYKGLVLGVHVFLFFDFFLCVFSSFIRSHSNCYSQHCVPFGFFNDHKPKAPNENKRVRARQCVCVCVFLGVSSEIMVVWCLVQNQKHYRITICILV